jgi:hypothetical protein
MQCRQLQGKAAMVSEGHDKPPDSEPEPPGPPAAPAGSVQEPTPGGLIAKGLAEFRSLSPIARLGTVVTVVGILVAVGNWVWPDPLRTIPPVDVGLITKAYGQDLDQQQLDQLIDALNSLRQKPAGAAADRLSIESALQEAEAGNTKLAKGILEQIFENREADQKAARQEQATAARHLASIVFVDDKAEALRLYREATTLNPQDMRAWQGLGDAAMVAGTTSERNGRSGNMPAWRRRTNRTGTRWRQVTASGTAFLAKAGPTKRWKPIPRLSTWRRLRLKPIRMAPRNCATCRSASTRSATCSSPTAVSIRP